MSYQNSISKVDEKKAEELYHSISLCNYCKTPFKECDTIIPGEGFLLGEIDVVKYKNRFWHRGCIFDFEKNKKIGVRFI